MPEAASHELGVEALVGRPAARDACRIYSDLAEHLLRIDCEGVRAIP